MSFGSGPSLDENFDFEIDETGDLDTSNGIEELHKDLAFQMSYSLERYLGSLRNTNVETNALTTATRVLNADSRVDRVLRSESDAQISEDGRTLRVNMNYISNDGEEKQFIYEL